MKTESRNYGKLAIVALAFTLAFSAPAFANDGDKGENATELKFIGNMENQPVFELSLANKEEDEYTVIFRDEYGNVLYNDKFKGTGITRKFLLKSEDLGDTALSVVVRSKKGTTEVYSINRNHTYVQETTINKVK
ncbi:hypothetical protein [Longitalea luteola]|uniref:hypothetical protein n=1 Tax=Longitalea luteola TaxID=2812563 RepID=UPI001A95D2D0|nr:hypothetical protein [Longitalea luteola]